MTDSPIAQEAADFPVQWDGAGEAALFWTRDIMHFPDAITPLGATFELAPISYGLDRATEEASLPINLRYKVINSYVYSAIAPRSADPAILAELGRQAEQAMPAAMQQLGSRWREVHMPEIWQDIATFRAFDYAGASDAEIAEHVAWAIDRRYPLYVIHFAAMLPIFPLAVIFADTYKRITGSTDEMASHVLLQGFSNRTVDAGHALWRLSREARRHPEVVEALAAEKPDEVLSQLEGTPAGREFAQAFRAYLDEFGWRGDSWIIDDRTWVDNPRTPLATLRGYLAKADEGSPVEQHARLGVEREAALASVRERLAGEPAEAREEFERLMRAALSIAEVQEDHNFYIDQMLQHLARRAFVEVGKRMVARGQLADPEDVLFLTTDELRDQTRRPGAEDLRPRVDERRSSLARWRMISPPPALGTPPPPPPADYQPSPIERGMMGFHGGPPKAGSATEIRGNAGSRGKVSGIARVAMTLSEATPLQPGEVLVCPTTSPPWTPLFATAAAVVTDTGGILSHCAVVAREFGIPAVVGTGVGTQRIRTGQRVTVDGAAGTVTLE